MSKTRKLIDIPDEHLLDLERLALEAIPRLKVKPYMEKVIIDHIREMKKKPPEISRR